MCSPPSLIFLSSAMRRANGLAYTLPPPDCAWAGTTEAAGAGAGAGAARFGGAAAGAGAAVLHNKRFNTTDFQNIRNALIKDKKIIIRNPYFIKNKASNKYYCK